MTAICSPLPTPGEPAISARETMHVVIVGHVDHGKSTLVGRLLADTGTLGDGKLEKVQDTCRRQGKTFEYAFLLDALEEEQGQGITIDAARVFFKTDRRDYIIIDAPGHIEFLKNMVTGAARAEAAILLIDAYEGVRENSRRHGYLLSMLGIKQVVVAVNKIDLVDYDRHAFDAIEREYRAFLSEIDVEPLQFIPVSAREGDFVADRSGHMSWFEGPTILEAMDALTRPLPNTALPLRMPVQDVYKFNVRGDDLRIIAGRVEPGTLEVGDAVLFQPSGKSSTIASIEVFSAPTPTGASAGESAAVTLSEQIYVARGDVMCHPPSAPMVSTRLRVNLFWLGRKPMVPGQRYRLKLGTASTEVRIGEIHRVLDASDLAATHTKGQIDRHDVADLVLHLRRPVAFDPTNVLEATGRFVIVDGYDIAGGGIVREAVADDLEQHRLETRIREHEWVRGQVGPERRAQAYGHRAGLVMLTGADDALKHQVASAVEHELVEQRHHAYLLDGKNLVLGIDADIDFDNVDELVRRFAEVTHVLLDAGLIVVSTTSVIGLGHTSTIAAHIAPIPMLVVQIGSDASVEEVGSEPDLHVSSNRPAEAIARDILEELRSLTHDDDD